MKLTQIIMIFSLIFFLMSCTTQKPQSIKPDQASQSESQLDNPIVNGDQGERIANSFSDYMPPPFHWITQSLKMYWKCEKEFPQSLKDLTLSGYSLFWPKVASNNHLVFLNEDSEYIPSETLFGSCQYDRTSTENITLSFIQIDLKNYRETDEISWKVVDMDLPGQPRGSLSGKSVAPSDIIEVMGGAVSAANIPNPNKAKCYALCGLFTNFLDISTDEYFNKTGSLPNSFVEILNENQSIIKENFNSFQRLLTDSGATFKWGFDYENKAEYIYLKYGDSELINRCWKYSSDKIWEQGECQFDDIDMSSPLLTNENILELQIPDEYLISIENIPV